MQHQTFQKSGFQSKFSTEIAIVSFIIGTIFFMLLQLYPTNIQILVYAFSLAVIAAIVNGIVIMNLLYHFIMQPDQREILAIKILIVLSNIPIATAYSYILFLS